MTQTEKGRFVQYPVQLIYARKDLTRDDKWVLLAIMGTCWTDGPHRLSYRQIEALSGVPVSLLSSYLDKKTGKHHEGIIDRLARAGDIRVEQRKEVDLITGKTRGQPQSYISINYSHIWQENASYCGQSVSYTNTSVPHPNESVPYENTSASNTNASVPYTNESVSVSRSESPPYITKIDQINTDKEDHVESSANSAFDANASPSSQEKDNQHGDTHSDPLVPGLRSGDPHLPGADSRQAGLPGGQPDRRVVQAADGHRAVAQQKIKETNGQSDLHAPIPSLSSNGLVTQQYSYSQPQDTGESEAIGDKVSSKKVTQPLVMPAEDAKWCAETAVQIVEAKKGSRYSKTTRSQELTEARKVLEMEFEGHCISREEFVLGWDDMSAWSWWEEHKMKPMIKHLRKDDKIISLLAFLTRRKKANHQRAVSPNNQGSALLSPEKQERNKQRLRERAAARAAAEQQGQTPSVQVAVN